MDDIGLPPSFAISFFHLVGQSTLQQGLAIPQIAQISWLAELRKGEKVPITVLFAEGNSIPALVRRLNNARGHLQFRYESKQQAPLRDYLAAVFGPRIEQGNAVLRVTEVRPRAFLFEPVTAGIRKGASLSLYLPHFHNCVKENIERMEEFVELKQGLVQIPYQDDYNQAEYNNRIAQTLQQSGWAKESRILDEIGLRCDFHKNGVWVEIEFGNARVYYQDYMKFLLALRYRSARLGVLLCPTNAFAQLLCDLGQKRAIAKRSDVAGRPPSYSGMMSYEKAIRELPFLAFMLSGSIVVAGIEIEGR